MWGQKERILLLTFYFCVMEFKYAINAYSKNPILQINEHIGFDEEDGQGIDGVKFSREVFEINVLIPELITFFINTMGGDVKQGYDIFNAIVSATCRTETIMQGFAYSVGGWLGLAGDIVKAYDYTTWMCHLPYDPTDESKRSEFLSKVAYSVAVIISQKSGRNGKTKLSVDEVLNLMRVKTYYTAQDLYDKGLIDEVLPSGNSNLVVNNSGELKVKYRELQRVVNKEIQQIKPNNIINNQNNNTMAFEKVLNRLQLAEGSGENAVLEAIADRDNKLNAANKQIEDLTGRERAANDNKEEMRKKLEKAQNDHNEMTSLYNKSKEELEKIKAEHEASNKELASLKIDNEELKGERRAKEQENKDILEAQRKEKAQNLVKKFQTAGKIPMKDEVAANWEKMAYDNFDQTSTILETMPVNMHVPHPDDKQPGNVGTGEEALKTVFGGGSDADMRAYNKAQRSKVK